MNMNSGSNQSDDRMATMVASGLSIGAGFGVALGLALHNLALGIAIGVGLGIAVGAALGRMGTVGKDVEGIASRTWLAPLFGIGLLLLLATGVVLFLLLAT